MFGNSLNALTFLISIVFDLYIIILIIRLILAYAGADYNQPIVQLIVKLTSFVIKPLRRFIPDIRGIELATIVLILVVEVVKFFFITILTYGIHNPLGLIILAVVDAIKLYLELLFYAIIIQWIISLIQPNAPALEILNKITYPITYPLRKFIPPIAGFDWSWIPALIILQLLIILIVDPLLAMGLGITVG